MNFFNFSSRRWYFALVFAVLCSSNLAMADCQIALGYCLDPSVNLSQELALPGVQTSLNTCVAKAEQLKDRCKYNPVVRVTFLDSTSKKIVYRGNLYRSSWRYRKLDALYRDSKASQFKVYQTPPPGGGGGGGKMNQY